MRKYSTEFQELLEIKFIDKWIDNYYRWVDLNTVLVSKYEDVMSDLTAEVKRISTHIGINLEHRQCKKIASEFEMNKQIDRIEKFKKKFPQKALNTNGTQYDPHSLLHINHIQSGEVGVWKDYLKDDQIEKIERKTEKWLIKNGYRLSIK